MSWNEGFQHLQIQMKDVLFATENFSPSKIIGGGGFGPVYKGELSFPDGQKRTVAFKRLDTRHGQGKSEFWKEITMLSRWKHGNLISLLYFCEEGVEKVIVYEYASRGSLDHHLGDAALTWIRRLKICVEAARAINYLHDPKDGHERVLHHDIKSSNILLDDDWTAKVSDFGLSKIGLANQQHTYNVTNVVGTPGYIDPRYLETCMLTKESDVYSFGVVLFEVMCGKLCYDCSSNQRRVFVPSWRKSFKEKRLDEIIFEALKDQIDNESLKTFSTIAYRCLNKHQKERPVMLEVVTELEVALEQQKSKSCVPEEVKSRGKGDGAGSSEYVDNEDSSQLGIREHILKAKIAKIIDIRGLVGLKGVATFLQMMKTESANNSIDLACRIMLVNVLSFTDRIDCLDGFIQFKGLSVLENWLEDFHHGKIQIYAEEFLYAVFLALDKLPVDLHALKTCTIEKSINRLRDYGNPQVQNKAKSLVNMWKKRV